MPELSGGEAQQVAICAAVAHGPRLILADEPTAELDEASARRVYEMLAQLAREGTSLIQVSHDPRSAAFADRVVAIRDGRLSEQWMHGSEVEQVPDSRGWIRIPPELLPSASRLPGLIATPRQDGLLLRPGTVGPQAWPGALTRARAAASAEPSVTTLDDGPRLELIGVAAAYPQAIRCSAIWNFRCVAANWLQSSDHPAPGSRPCSAWRPASWTRSPARSWWAATTGLVGTAPSGRSYDTIESPWPRSGRSWSNR